MGQFHFEETGALMTDLYHVQKCMIEVCQSEWGQLKFQHGLVNFGLLVVIIGLEPAIKSCSQETISIHIIMEPGEMQ